MNKKSKKKYELLTVFQYIPQRLRLLNTYFETGVCKENGQFKRFVYQVSFDFAVVWYYIKMIKCTPLQNGKSNVRRRHKYFKSYLCLTPIDAFKLLPFIALHFFLLAHIIILTTHVAEKHICQQKSLRVTHTCPNEFIKPKNCPLMASNLTSSKIYTDGCQFWGCKLFNTLRLRRNGRDFPDDILKCIFLNKDICISIRLRFHWSLFVRVQLTKFQHWFR